MNLNKTAIWLLMTMLIPVFFSGAIYAAHHREFSCDGKFATTGQNLEEVRSALGEPFQVEENKSQDQQSHQTRSPQVIKLIYKCGLKTYALVFEDQTLISIYQIMENDSEPEAEYEK